MKLTLAILLMQAGVGTNDFPDVPCGIAQILSGCNATPAPPGTPLSQTPQPGCLAAMMPPYCLAPAQPTVVSAVAR